MMKRKTVRYAKTWIKNILTHTTSDKTNQEKKVEFRRKSIIKKAGRYIEIPSFTPSTETKSAFQAHV